MIISKKGKIMILKILPVKAGWIEQTNCYIIQDENTKETIVIDPGGEANKIIELLEIMDSKLKYIYLTHCHGDHIEATNKVKKEKGGKVIIHREDADGLNNPEINMTIYIGQEPQNIEIDSRVDDGDLIHLGELEFKIIHTPGHTKGGSCLYCEKEKILFAGDTLFKGAWGRTDLPTSNFKSIINSIQNKLLTLPDDTFVYSGHGEVTTIREEEPIYYNLKPREE